MCQYLGITLVRLVATTTASFKRPTGQVLSVEGRHGVLFTTNCLLLVGENLSKLFGFVYLCLGRVRVGFAAGA